MKPEELSEEFGIKFERDAEILRELKWRLNELGSSSMAEYSLDDYDRVINAAMKECWFKESKLGMCRDVMAQVQELERQMMVFVETLSC